MVDWKVLQISGSLPMGSHYTLPERSVATCFRFDLREVRRVAANESQVFPRPPCDGPFGDGDRLDDCGGVSELECYGL